VITDQVGRQPLWADRDRSARVGAIPVPAEVRRRLERRAELSGRSLQAEARLALSTWAQGRDA